MTDQVAEGQVEAPQVTEPVAEDHKSMLSRLVARLDVVAVGLDHELAALVAKAKAIL